MSPPKNPGIPCKFNTPHVSYKIPFSTNLGDTLLYKKVETIPPIAPIIKAEKGF